MASSPISESLSMAIRICLSLFERDQVVFSFSSTSVQLTFCYDSKFEAASSGSRTYTRQTTLLLLSLPQCLHSSLLIHTFLLQERLCQWKLAREKLLYKTRSQEEIPDMHDFCSVDEVELQQIEVDHESRQVLSRKVDTLKYGISSTFCKERRLMKRQYESFKIQINGLIAKFQDVPTTGWKMKDGTPWPGNDSTNHPGMMQVRVSALLTNGAYILNLDCGQYISNSRAFLEAMCFLMDPSNKKICYVQFSQRFDGIDANDRYANHNTIFYDVNLKALDGIQGPIYVGTGCFFSRKALYGYDPSSETKMLNTSCSGSGKLSSLDNQWSLFFCSCY
ncbi:hypothetical protein L1049_004231 [Liquidambar formosana]|uniref:Uncharacterized protein n=1 Tax=Liquidambar formosana TaxID=63359 RepID=A0AAP0WVY2_LIQFO